MLMSRSKSKLDEMQEQKLLKIEHNCTWFVFWSLLLAIVVQFIMGMGKPNLLENVAGEWIVFMCFDIYMIVSCLKNGIWDRKLEPNFKTNMVVSLISSAIVGMVFFFVTLRYGKFTGSIAAGVFMFIIVFILCFFALSTLAVLYKKRVEKLENEGNEES
jgi:cation transport ATPase